MIGGTRRLGDSDIITAGPGPGSQIAAENLSYGVKATVVCFRGGRAPTRRNLGAASLTSFVVYRDAAAAVAQAGRQLLLGCGNAVTSAGQDHDGPGTVTLGPAPVCRRRRRRARSLARGPGPQAGRPGAAAPRPGCPGSRTSIAQPALWYNRRDLRSLQMIVPME